MSRRQGRRRTAVRAIKATFPDISLRVDRWAARPDFVVIEWTITATFGGEHIELPGADRCGRWWTHRRGGVLELSR